MERLIRFFVERHMLVHVIVAVAVMLGVVQATRASRETFPNVTVPKLFVNGVLPGASARDVETKITIPIQEAIEELNGVKEFSTVVSDASSHSEIDLHDGFETPRIIEAEQDLRVLLDGISDFPPEMEDDPVIQRMNPKLFPVVQVALAGPTDAISAVAQRLERRLRTLDEVSKVSIAGLQDPEVRILVDPVRARAHGVTLLDVVGAVQRRNVSSTGGLFESERDRRQVVVWSRFEDPLEVADTVIRSVPGSGTLSVADVASIELAREDTGLLVHTNGEPGLALVVNKQDDADIVDTVDAVRAEVEAYPLPPEVSATFVRDESFMTRNRLQLMWNNGIMGLVLVAVTLFVFLTPMAAGWTLAGLPVVFLTTLVLFPVLGFTINIVTLTGLVVVLGMVVDDAVVVSERIVSRRQAGEERRTAAIKGAAEMARPVFASAITTMLAFMPLWGLGGMAGRMTASMPPVIILALCVSVLESFIVLPAHMSMGVRSATTAKREFMKRLEERYRRMLRVTLHHRPTVVACFFAVLVVVFAFVVPNTKVTLFPQDDAEAAYIKVSLPIGTPLERTEAVVASIERQIPPVMGEDLLAVVSRIGHQNPEDFEASRGSAENEAVIITMVRPVGRTKTAAEWTEILEAKLAVPVEARVFYETEFMGPPVGRPVTVHVSADDNELRRATAMEVADWIGRQDGISNVQVDERPGTPQVELVLDYDRLAQRGLDPEAVAQTVQLAFHGMKASEHRTLEDTTAFRVQLEPSARRSLDALLEIPVRSTSGELVQLRDVVTPIEVPAVSKIYHRNGRRTATVTAGFTTESGLTPLDFAQQIESGLMPRYAGDHDLHISIGGEAVETRKTGGDMGVVALLVFAGITLVIAVMLGSFLEAAFVVSIIPFAIASVLLAFFLHRQAISMFAMMGAIGLAGVVVNASIVMVDAVHRRLRAAGDVPQDDREELIIDAVVTRLRPILVTTLTTLGGVMPMAYGIGGHDAVVAPMSLAIGWGLAFSTVVTLFLVPTLYTLANDVRQMRKKVPEPAPESSPEPAIRLASGR